MGPLPTECQQESAILARLLAEFHSPSWTWFVACDEAASKKVEDHIGFTRKCQSQPLTFARAESFHSIPAVRIASLMLAILAKTCPPRLKELPR